VVIAAIFEFLGALLLGGQVTRTIAGSIAKTSTFKSYPALFMFGEWVIIPDECQYY
jgi:sodium-dependent phosphate transporter